MVDRDSRTDTAVERLVWRGGKFVAAPDPEPSMQWMDYKWALRARKLPGKAYQLASALALLAKLRGDTTVTPSKRVLEDFGIGKWALRDGLKTLELAEFVSVDRGNGRLPRVTLLDYQLRSGNGK